MELHFLIYAISGALLLGIGLTSIYLEQSILTPSIIYLLFGVLLGPYALHLVSFDISAHWAMIEYVTELVVIISVFSAGLKMKPLLGQRKWLSPFKLATIGVVIAVGLICFFGVTVLHLSLPVALLLGAILAPTDPVLASAVQVEHENDKDSLRFTLTAEAGMNDGSAFPFLFLALGLMGFHELGPGFSTWFGIEVSRFGVTRFPQPSRERKKLKPPRKRSLHSTTIWKRWESSSASSLSERYFGLNISPRRIFSSRHC
ncbi:MAG: hypothetical protein EOP05_21110 [Proteobacteria bacterium]|nr:MAG: hypothetical protein EOP05_21110 [Pseudomonadota bacterium]